ncbi:hypothetical protein NDU88_005170 [Pleurodeles waltl]|uniref:Uncharacterized protein n=1 Tax=Pleurodeles waltl TaxID=8319 RepID=A0AAV7L323_PLEWA|nr:hypothetical protein NDU88_005170 [Pleurodeles waltl]
MVLQVPYNEGAETKWWRPGREVEKTHVGRVKTCAPAGRQSETLAAPSHHRQPCLVCAKYEGDQDNRGSVTISSTPTVRKQCRGTEERKPQNI